MKENMEGDEEVVLKGSSLYDYLCSTGFSNFESIELYPKNSLRVSDGGRKEITPALAPKWASDHLCCILKCGLILDDHRSFVEYFLPLQTDTDPPYRICMALGCLSWATTFGSLLHIIRKASYSRFSTSLCVFSSIGAVYLSKSVFQIRLYSQSFSKLCGMLGSLEDLLIQFKRMIFLVQQNELIACSFSLHCSEMIELRKCVWKALSASIKDMYEFFTAIKEVPLVYNADSALCSFSSEDMTCVPSTADETQLSIESLKKMYNTYILIQSEFLRRLALCYCPEMWCTSTVENIIVYSKVHFSKIEQWSRTLGTSLAQEYKLFRSIGGSRGKRAQLRIPVTSSWDFADLYVGVRSASLHLQSILVQNQDIEDLLESKDSVNWKDNKEFLKSIAQILVDIQKELRSCQTCVGDSLVQVLKMTTSEELPKLTPAGIVNASGVKAEERPDSELNPPAVDEVFELLIPLEGKGSYVDEDYLDDVSAEEKEKRAKEKESSKRVLQELKVVLVKKADEWKERERRAMESKGLVYTAPEQEGDIVKKDNLDFPGELEWLPTGEENVWPLPRLKGNILNHRFTGDRNPNMSTPSLEAQLQPSDLRKARAEESKQSCFDSRPKPGFEASLLAEAMQLSQKMNFSKTEEVFLDSEDEDKTNI